MEWLNKNAEKEAVVFGSNETSHLTVIYTPLNVLFHRALCCTTLSATKSRVLDILFLFYRLRGVEGESVLEVFTNERKIVSTQIYGIYYRKLMGSYEAIPDEKIEEIAELYKETLFIPTSEWLRQILTQYEVEYIVWDKENDPDWQLEKYSFLKEVAVFNDIAIYQFSKDNG